MKARNIALKTKRYLTISSVLLNLIAAGGVIGMTYALGSGMIGSANAMSSLHREDPMMRTQMAALAASSFALKPPPVRKVGK